MTGCLLICAKTDLLRFWGKVDKIEYKNIENITSKNGLKGGTVKTTETLNLTLKLYMCSNS